MQIDLSPEEKVTFLVSLSKRMGVSADEILSMYLLLEDRLFFLFDLLQDRTVKFPSMRSFHRGLSLAGKTRLIKLKKPSYFVNGVESYRENIVSGDSVFVEGGDVEVVGSPLVFLGSTYILGREWEEER